MKANGNHRVIDKMRLKNLKVIKGAFCGSAAEVLSQTENRRRGANKGSIGHKSRMNVGLVGHSYHLGMPRCYLFFSIGPGLVFLNAITILSKIVQIR